MNDQEARDRLLAAAEGLFYERGIQAVGIDEIRAASGVSLKRLYHCFPSKERLVEAYLERRDRQWQDSLARHVDRRADPRQRVLAVFGFLAEWFAMPDFRGCAFINAFGELGTKSETITRITRNHKRRLRHYLAGLAAAAGAAAPHVLADQLLLLIDGAIVSAATGANPRAAAHAKAAARVLLAATCTYQPEQAGTKPSP
jgi:AcrR family transcriptional regulator